MVKVSLIVVSCLAIACPIFQTVTSEKILFLFPIGSKSHKNVFDPLIEALASRGHQVSVISPYKSSKLHPNVKEIVPNKANMKEVLADPFKVRRDGKFSMLFFNMSNILDASHEIYNNPEFQEMTNQSYDLVIQNGFLNTAFDGIIYKLKAPHIILTTLAAPSFITELTGNYLPLSFVPNVFLELTDRMTFSERLLNYWAELLSKVVAKFIFLDPTRAVYQQHLGSDYPDFYTIQRNVSLILMNSYFSLTSPRPNLPDNIEVGGMHCRAPKPLPKDLDDFLSSSEDGFVYFSLGSIVQAQTMPENTKKAFLQVFSKLKQRVIWKWEGEMDDLPPNVKISKWLPQQDILGHPKIRVFMSHGGLLSTQESIYHGVPIIGLPVFGDQDLNMRLAENQGYALRVEILDLDPVDLEHKLDRILNEPQFGQKAKHMSAIFRDQMQSPLERAVFWTEYVMRHKGAPHLRSGARDLNYFQAKSFDVLGFMAAVLILIISTIVMTCKFVVRKLCSNSKRKLVSLDAKKKKK